MTKGCVCAVCEYGPDATEVPKKAVWHADVFCGIGAQETGEDGQVRSIPAYVKPFFSDDSAPSACSKMQAHVELMASRTRQLRAA